MTNFYIRFICSSIYGKANINFNGERKKEDLILFAERADALVDS
jgi:hypothetical protein